MSWAVHEVDQEVHVAPVLDSRNHHLVGSCACRPRLEPPQEGKRPLWIHNSFDGREFCERAIAALEGARN